MATQNKPEVPNHGTRSTNTKPPGIVKPGASPNAAPKVKVTQAPPPPAPTPKNPA